ncbi:hypothetical protein FACS189491_03820 [Spirochaetia bacterium]|nr:hypothetical protein FACS189491_03820 [Spirochaetia bacterium]
MKSVMKFLDVSVFALMTLVMGCSSTPANNANTIVNTGTINEVKIESINSASSQSPVDRDGKGIQSNAQQKGTPLKPVIQQVAYRKQGNGHFYIFMDSIPDARFDSEYNIIGIVYYVFISNTDIIPNQWAGRIDSVHGGKDFMAGVFSPFNNIGINSQPGEKCYVWVQAGNKKGKSPVSEPFVFVF